MYIAVIIIILLLICFYLYKINNFNPYDFNGIFRRCFYCTHDLNKCINESEYPYSCFNKYELCKSLYC